MLYLSHNNKKGPEIMKIKDITGEEHEVSAEDCDQCGADLAHCECDSEEAEYF